MARGNDEEIWVSTLVEAKGRGFKGQWERMGRAGGGGAKEKFGMREHVLWAG